MNAGAKYDLVLMDIIMPNLDGVSATHLIRQFDNTPIVAMTSNIRSDDISMYFAHGMNDVLPKPFTKEGLLNMLEKHLSHLKKHPHPLDTESMGAPPMVSGVRRTLKEDESPITSPAGMSGWNSPANMPSISPASTQTDDPYMQAVHNNAGPGPYQQNMQPSAAYNQRPPQGSLPQHRRQISDISGGANEVGGDSKRQQICLAHHDDVPALKSDDGCVTDTMSARLVLTIREMHSHCAEPFSSVIAGVTKQGWNGRTIAPEEEAASPRPESRLRFARCSHAALQIRRLS
nr:transcription factor skn7 [Quercus suber]